jgi:hypothetical protein
LGGGATGSSRCCRCGSRRSTARGGAGGRCGCGCCSCCSLSLYTWHTRSVNPPPPKSRQYQPSAADTHKVWPRPLLCFLPPRPRPGAPPPLPLKARARQCPPPRAAPPTTSDCRTKGGASAHRVGSSSALGNACGARFRAFSTPSPQVSSRPPTRFSSTGTWGSLPACRITKTAQLPPGAWPALPLKEAEAHEVQVQNRSPISRGGRGLYQRPVFRPKVKSPIPSWTKLDLEDQVQTKVRSAPGPRNPSPSSSPIN